MTTELRHPTTCEEGFFQGALGTRLFFRFWQTERPRAALLFVHGLGEHSGRYGFPAAFFVPRGFNVYAFDHRGHGRSPGPRSYAPSLKTLVEDIRHALSMIHRREAGRPVFLVGHSLGGQLVVNYGLSYQNSQEGIILSSPNIALKMPVPRFKAAIGRRLANLFPQFLVKNEINPLWISHDPEVVRAYRDDTMVLKKISLKLADLILENQDLLPKRAPDFKVPVLFMHGGADRVCSPLATEAFYQKAGSKDKRLKIFPGFYHEIFNEIGRESVFKEMEAWILKRLKKVP